MDKTLFSIRDKALVLRFSRLGRLPPALYATEILNEAGLPVLVLEFGNVTEKEKEITDPPPRLRWEARGARFIPSPLRPVFILATTFIRLCSLVHQGERPHLTVSHGPQENFLSYFLYRFFNIPYVVHVHEVYEKKEIKGFVGRLLFSMEKTVLSHARFLLFPEEERIKLYTVRYRLTCPSFLVPNYPRKMTLPTPIDLRKKLNLPENAVLMAYVGGIGEHNLIEDAIKAIGPLSNVHFLLWGWGGKTYLEKIKALATSLDMEKRVILMGELKEDKWNLLSSVDLSYCIYSMDLLRMKLGVTASNKLFESMACKVPVVAPPTFTFVEEQGVGVIAPSLDVEGMRAAISKLAENKLLRNSLGARGRELFESTYYYEKQFQPALEAFERLFIKKEPTLNAA